MDEKQFSYPLELGVSMFSGRHALKVNAYQELYMQAVEPHLMNIGMDEAKLMAELEVAWVLIALTMEPKRPIRPSDRLHAKTWNSTEKARLLFRREIAFYDERDEVVLTGATFSALLDLKTRRVCTDRALISRFNLPAGEELVEASDRLRMKTPLLEPVEILTARPSWEDAVGHVNNFRYGEMVYDALSPEQRENMENLKRLELYFVSETKPGDALTLHRVDEGDDTTVTVTLPEQIRPAFAAKLRFRA